jgi:AmiR/NasT family two-component response regulator
LSAVPSELGAPATAWPVEAVQAVRELGERVEQLQRALDSRIVIEQAKGILAERLRLAPDDAFAVLRGAARSSQMRLHDLAGAVVLTRETPAPVIRELARRREEH